MRLILIRHGESEGNAAGVLQGVRDYGLTPLGRVQAEAIAKRLEAEEFDRIVASPLRRAAETAQIVSARTGREIRWDPSLKEYDIGEASGLTGPEMIARFPDSREAYVRGDERRFPGEEGRTVFHERIAGFVVAAKEEGGTTVAVAHGGVIAAICYNVLGIDPRRRGLFTVANCAVTEVHLDRRGGFVLARHNDVCHLSGVVTDVDRG